MCEAWPESLGRPTEPRQGISWKMEGKRSDWRAALNLTSLQDSRSFKETNKTAGRSGDQHA